MALTAKHIEIVRSSKPWLNSMTTVSSNALIDVLSLHFTRVGVTIVDDLSSLESLVELQPDLVFLGMKYVPVDPSLGRQSPQIWLADYLEVNNIAYTGSNQAAHELELDKSLGKNRVMDFGLATSPFIVVKQTVRLNKRQFNLNFPLFVKPTNRGGGVGIDSNSVVNNFDELEAKLEALSQENQADALIEEYMPGREFSVAILKSDSSDFYTAMPIELIAPSDDQGIKMLSKKVKASNVEAVKAVPEGIIRDKVNMLAIKAFNALGARDYGRIDIRLDKYDEPQFLEANLIPSLIAGYGSFPKACLVNVGLDYDQMIIKIVNLALSRQTNSVISEDILEFENIAPVSDLKVII